MKQLLFFFAEVLGGQRCWTEMRKSLKIGTRTHLLEQSLCWSPEPTQRLSPWTGGMWCCRMYPESSPVPQHQRMMPKAWKGVCSMRCDAFHSRAPATARSLGHYGSRQIKSKNNFFPDPVQCSDFPERLCCDVRKKKTNLMHHSNPGGLSQRGASDALTFVSNHMHRGQYRASGSHLRSGSLVHSLHLVLHPRKQDLTSNCSKRISSCSPMALTHDFYN